MNAELGAAWHTPRFRFLVAGRALAEVAAAVGPIAIAFAVLDLTGSPRALSVVVASRAFATIALVFVGGVLADKFSRTLLLQGTETVAGISQFMLALVCICHFGTIPIIASLSMINGVAAAISLPSSSAVVPDLVPGTLLTQANALIRMTSAIGRIVGVALGGILVTSVGSGLALACTALLFFAAALSYRCCGIPASPRRAERTGMLKQLLEGWVHVRTRRWILVIILQFTVVNAVTAATFTVLGPNTADQTVGRAGWSLVLAANALGAITGAALAAWWQSRVPHPFPAAVALILWGAAPPIMMAEAPHIASLAVVMFCFGCAVEIFAVTWDTSLQSGLPPNVLARVYSWDLLGSLSAIPLGQILAGNLASQYGTPNVLLGAGLLIVLVTALALLDPQVRRARIATPHG